MRSRYHNDGSIDYEADREIEMLRHVDAELERLRRAEAERGPTYGFDAEEPLFKPTVKLLKKAGHLDPASGMTQLELFPMPSVCKPAPLSLPLPQSISSPAGIPEFLKSKPKSNS